MTLLVSWPQSILYYLGIRQSLLPWFWDLPYTCFGLARTILWSLSCHSHLFMPIFGIVGQSSLFSDCINLLHRLYQCENLLAPWQASPPMLFAQWEEAHAHQRWHPWLFELRAYTESSLLTLGKPRLHAPWDALQGLGRSLKCPAPSARTLAIGWPCPSDSPELPPQRDLSAAVCTALGIHILLSNC